MECTVFVFSYHASNKWHFFYIHGLQQPNLGSHYWVRVDQLVRSSTPSKDLLCEVHDLIHFVNIWRHLKHCFNITSLARVLNLKYMLTNLSKDDNESIYDYLKKIKTIANSLAAIQSPVFDLELI